MLQFYSGTFGLKPDHVVLICVIFGVRSRRYAISFFFEKIGSIASKMTIFGKYHGKTFVKENTFERKNVTCASTS